MHKCSVIRNRSCQLQQALPSYNTLTARLHAFNP